MLQGITQVILQGAEPVLYYPKVLKGRFASARCYASRTFGLQGVLLLGVLKGLCRCLLSGSLKFSFLSPCSRAFLFLVSSVLTHVTLCHWHVNSMSLGRLSFRVLPEPAVPQRIDGHHSAPLPTLDIRFHGRLGSIRHTEVVVISSF